MVNLADGATVRLPNGVRVTAEPGHLPGLAWLLRHPWAQWAITDAGDVVTLTTVKGKPTRRATVCRVGDLREG